MARDSDAACVAPPAPLPPLNKGLKYAPAPNARTSAVTPITTHFTGNFLLGADNTFAPASDSEVTACPEYTDARSALCPLPLDRGRFPSNVSRSSMTSWMLL